MCLIVDNNVIARVLNGKNDPDFADLFGCLFESGGLVVVIVYGGRLRQEYQGNHDVVRRLAILDRAGRARVIPDTDVDNEEQAVIASGLCVSDDQHVIALAKVSGVRVLCSHDKGLHRDFTNKRLIDNPRGKIYQTSRHRRLLIQACRN